MHPYGDSSLDELLAAAAPVTDRDLDRPEVRAATRALLEELPMAAHPAASPATTDDRPPLDIGPARGVGARTTDDSVDELPAGEDRPRRRGRVAVTAAVAAVALALGFATVAGGGDDAGDPVDSLDPADEPIADAPAPTADRLDTLCEWSTWWLDGHAVGDQDAQVEAMVGTRVVALAARLEGDEHALLRAEALMSPMSEGDRATVEARHAESCSG